jgi:hypothetical protein
MTPMSRFLRCAAGLLALMLAGVLAAVPAFAKGHHGRPAWALPEPAQPAWAVPLRRQFVGHWAPAKPPALAALKIAPPSARPKTVAVAAGPRIDGSGLHPRQGVVGGPAGRIGTRLDGAMMRRKH